MSQLEQQLPSLAVHLSPEGAVQSALGTGEYSPGLGFLECHGVWYTVALAAPSVLFIAYLVAHARRSFAKLSYGRSYVIIAYYGLLWTVTLLNLLWCLLQGWQCFPEKELSWNILSLFTTSGILFLEISLVAFLLQGNQVDGLEILTRTLIISGIIIAVDLILKAICIFLVGVPLFLDASSIASGGKWGVWIAYKLLLSIVYGSILFMYHSKWRERLPARQAFYSYICAVFLLNAIALFACVLATNGAAFGFWLYNLTTVCCHSLYLPLVYATFLVDFFQEEDMRLENVYYSEMKDAGFFDADWE